MHFRVDCLTFNKVFAIKGAPISFGFRALTGLNTASSIPQQWVGIWSRKRAIFTRRYSWFIRNIAQQDTMK